MKITCLHTAQSHVAGFAKLFDSAGWDGALDHIVRADLLARAQRDGVQAVADDLQDVVGDLAGSDAILCTCSTLGQVVENLAGARVLRIDRPATEAAVSYRHVMVVICLESTRGPTMALFDACARGQGAQARVVVCTDAWPHFEAGDMTAFHRRIVQSVARAMADAPETDCILLAQASMQGAALFLSDLGRPVLTTPALAVRRAIKTARLKPL